jgi:hypothetical protein
VLSTFILQFTQFEVGSSNNIFRLLVMDADWHSKARYSKTQKPERIRPGASRHIPFYLDIGELLDKWTQSSTCVWSACCTLLSKIIVISASSQSRRIIDLDRQRMGTEPQSRKDQREWPTGRKGEAAGGKKGVKGGTSGYRGAQTSQILGQDAG